MGSKNFERIDVSEGDRERGVTRAHSNLMEQAIAGASDARDLTKLSLSDLPRDVLGEMGTDDALSLVGQRAHLEKQDMEVNSPIKPIVDQVGKKEGTLEVTGQESNGKIKATVQWKRMAREKGKK